MKNILTTLLILLSVVGISQTKIQQTKVQIDVENKNGVEQYNLKLEQEIDGKTVVTEKSYSSIDEMKNDPELEGINLMVMNGGTKSISTKDGSKHIVIKVDGAGAGEKNEMVFFSDNEDGEEMKIEVVVDEDGTKHIFKNGEEIDMSTLHKEDGEHTMIFISENGEHADLEEIAKEGDHKIMFISQENDGDEDINIEVTVDEDGTKHIFKNGEEIDMDEFHEGSGNVFMFKSGDGDSLHIEERMEVEVSVDEDGNHHVVVNGEEVDYDEWKENNQSPVHSSNMVWVEEGENGQKITKEIIIIKGEDGDEQNVKVEVIVSKIVLHIEDMSADDKDAFSLEDNKALKLDDFNFYPNPNNGTFQLAFQGKEKATSVRVTDINGKEVYAEYLQNFSGTYDKEISLSGLKKGIYLLQVVQGNKAVNKKIVIE